MKRTLLAMLCLSIAIMAAVSFTGAFAEEQTSAEILFRGIEWKLPLHEYVQRIVEDVGEDGVLHIETAEHSISYENVTGELIPTQHYRCYRTKIELDGVKVAGHAVDFILLESIPAVKGNCIVDDADDTLVVSATYYLTYDLDEWYEEVSYTEDQFEEIGEKLTYLYGDSDNRYSFLTGYKQWNGDGSVVSLRFYDSDKSITISYRTTETDALLQELDEVYEEYTRMNPYLSHELSGL